MIESPSYLVATFPKFSRSNIVGNISLENLNLGIHERTRRTCDISFHFMGVASKIEEFFKEILALAFGGHVVGSNL